MNIKRKLFQKNSSKEISLISSHQDLYEFADILATRSDAKYIIDIASGGYEKFVNFHLRYQVIIVDSRENLVGVKDYLPGAILIEMDLEKQFPTFSDEVLRQSVLISARAVSIIRNREIYFKGISKLSYKVPFVLLAFVDTVRAGHLSESVQDSCNHWDIRTVATINRKYKFNKCDLGYSKLFIDNSYKPFIVCLTGTESNPSDFKGEQKRILATMAVFNEEDIIRYTMEHLLKEGVDLHIMDNWSTDSTHSIVCEMKDKYPGRVNVEMFPSKESQEFDLASVTKRSVEIASTSGYEWIMHYDADEIRISPWIGVSFAQAITVIDSWGYNAIDFTILNFIPVIDGYIGDTSPTEFFNYSDFGKHPAHFIQVKCWKNNQLKTNLSDSGGHKVEFEGRKIYPLKFLTKHYPLRSSAHGKRKIFKERRPRYSKEELSKGMHVHYNCITEDHNFIESPRNNIYYSEEYFNAEYFVERLSGVGLVREE